MQHFQNIKCTVEGLSKPLRLTLTGSCVGVQPTRNDASHFSTHVRQKDTKPLQVSQKSYGNNCISKSRFCKIAVMHRNDDSNKIKLTAQILTRLKLIA